MPNTVKPRKISQKHAHNQDYQEMQAEEAHYNAEQHGFILNFEEEEWQETEDEIFEMIKLQ